MAYRKKELEKVMETTESTSVCNLQQTVSYDGGVGPNCVFSPVGVSVFMQSYITKYYISGLWRNNLVA